MLRQKIETTSLGTAWAQPEHKLRTTCAQFMRLVHSPMTKACSVGKTHGFVHFLYPGKPCAFPQPKAMLLTLLDGYFSTPSTELTKTTTI